MAVWVVRAGREGEQEQFALDNGYAVIDWRELGDVRQFENRGELRAAMENAYPEEPQAWPQFVGETWAFAQSINTEDLFVLPLKRLDGKLVGSVRESGIIAVGKFDGEYEYAVDAPPGTEHRRKVRWVGRGIPRIGLDDDISASLENTQLTVFQPRFSRAEERIRKIAEGR